MRVPCSTLSRATCAALLWIVAVPAQGSIVIPPAAATQEGNSLSNDPFGYDFARFVTYVGRPLLGGLPAGASIKAISYRRDGQLTNPATLTRTFRGQKLLPLVTIRLENYTGPVQNPPPQFPMRWTQVFNPKLVDFPDLPLPGSGLPQFSVRFMLDAPFPYRGPNLGIDYYSIELTGARTPTYPYYVDSIQTTPSSGTTGLITPSAVGCPDGENRATGFAPDPGAGDLELYLFGAPPSVGAFACLGGSVTSWGGLALPYELGLFGLAGCWVYTDWTVCIPTMTSTSGVAEFRTPVAATPTLAGATMYGQWVVRDGRVNPAFPFATSDGLAMTFGTNVGSNVLPISSVSLIGTRVQNAQTGFVAVGSGHVMQIDW